MAQFDIFGLRADLLAWLSNGGIKNSLSCFDTSFDDPGILIAPLTF